MHSNPKAVWERALPFPLQRTSFLINKNDDLEVCDFGNASRMDEGEIMRLTGIQCTPIYAPPEFFIQGCIFPTSDIWSLGMILYRIYYCKNFWNMNELTQYIENLKAQKIKTLNPTVNEDPICSNRITEIIRGCLHHDPNQRITIENIITAFDSYLVSIYQSQIDSSPVLKYL